MTSTYTRKSQGKDLVNVMLTSVQSNVGFSFRMYQRTMLPITFLTWNSSKNHSSCDCQKILPIYSLKMGDYSEIHRITES